MLFCINIFHLHHKQVLPRDFYFYCKLPETNLLYALLLIWIRMNEYGVSGITNNITEVDSYGGEDK